MDAEIPRLPGDDLLVSGNRPFIVARAGQGAPEIPVGLGQAGLGANGRLQVRNRTISLAPREADIPQVLIRQTMVGVFLQFPLQVGQSLVVTIHLPECATHSEMDAGEVRR